MHRVRGRETRPTIPFEYTYTYTIASFSPRPAVPCLCLSLPWFRVTCASPGEQVPESASQLFRTSNAVSTMECTFITTRSHEARPELPLGSHPSSIILHQPISFFCHHASYIVLGEPDPDVFGWAVHRQKEEDCGCGHGHKVGRQ